MDQIVIAIDGGHVERDTAHGGIWKSDPHKEVAHRERCEKALVFRGAGRKSRHVVIGFMQTGRDDR